MAESPLIHRRRPQRGRTFDLAGVAVLGRDTSAGIVLEDAESSRRHASISVEGTTASVEDLGSTNGTFVNGERIQGSRQLSSGDKIRIGTTVLEFKAPEPADDVQATRVASAIPDPEVTRAREVPDFTAGPPADARTETPGAPPAPEPAAPPIPEPVASSEPPPPPEPSVPPVPEPPPPRSTSPRRRPRRRHRRRPRASAAPACHGELPAAAPGRRAATSSRRRLRPAAGAARAAGGASPRRPAAPRWPTAARAASRPAGTRWTSRWTTRERHLALARLLPGLPPDPADLRPLLRAVRGLRRSVRRVLRRRCSPVAGRPGSSSSRACCAGPRGWAVTRT